MEREPIPPFDQRIAWAADERDGRERRFVQASGRDAHDGRLTENRIREWIESGIRGEDHIRSACNRWIEAEARKGNQQTGGAPAAAGARRVPRKKGGARADSAAGAFTRSVEGAPDAVSTITVEDPMLLDGSVFGWVRTVVKAADAPPDAPPLVDVLNFMDIADAGAQAAWDREICGYMRDANAHDRPGERALTFHAVTRKVIDDVTVIERVDLFDDPAPDDRLYHDTPIGMLPRDGMTLCFGSRGSGKSWTTRLLALHLAAAGVPTAWIDLEDGAVGDAVAQRCVRGLDDADRAAVRGNLKRYRAPKLSHAAGIAKLKQAIADDFKECGGCQFIIVDSATAVVQDELNTAAAAAGFYEKMRSLDVPGGFVIAHTAKSNAGRGADDGATAYGSTVWESIPRLVFCVQSDTDTDEWDQAGGATSAPSSQPGAPVDPFNEPVVAAVEPLPFVVKVEVTKTNGVSRIGSGGLLRAAWRAGVFVFEHRPLNGKSAAERRDDRWSDWLKALLDLLTDSGPQSSNSIISKIEIDGKKFSRAGVLKRLPGLVLQGILAVERGGRGGGNLYRIPTGSAHSE